MVRKESVNFQLKFEKRNKREFIDVQVMQFINFSHRIEKEE